MSAEVLTPEAFMEAVDRLAAAEPVLAGVARRWGLLDAWAERWRPQRAVAARFLWHDYLSRRGRGSAG